MKNSITDTKEKVKKVIIERLKIKADAQEISGDTNLIGKGLGLDSVSLMELVVAIEQEFEIDIDDEDINAALFQNVNTLSEYVCRKLELQ